MCTWTKPEHTNGPIQLYRVNLIDDGSTTHTYETSGTHFECNNTVEHGETYTLSVKAKTDRWGEYTSKTVQYLQSGELIIFS